MAPQHSAYTPPPGTRTLSHAVHFLFDQRLHLVAETRAAESFGVAADCRRIERASDRLRNGVGKGGRRAFIYERSGFAVDHGFLCASTIQRDHRPPACLRLGRTILKSSRPA